MPALDAEPVPAKPVVPAEPSGATELVSEARGRQQQAEPLSVSTPRAQLALGGAPASAGSSPNSPGERLSNPRGALVPRQTRPAVHIGHLEVVVVAPETASGPAQPTSASAERPSGGRLASRRFLRAL
ncbi:MAG: hypothetical protein AAF560_08735 [Acidobacteriota bacterium]